MAAQHSRYGDYSTRYKFNGKEQDEATGFYYYGARYYAPSLSRWLSTDPLAEKYQGFSPYNYTLNNPVMLVDPDGRRIVIAGTSKFQKKVWEYLFSLAMNSETGYEQLHNAIESNETLVIFAGDDNNVAYGGKKNKDAYSTLTINFEKAEKSKDGAPGSIESTLGHELAHFNMDIKGFLSDKKDGTLLIGISPEEIPALEIENSIRKELGIGERKSYSGLDFYGKELGKNKKYSGYYPKEKTTEYAPIKKGVYSIEKRMKYINNINTYTRKHGKTYYRDGRYISGEKVGNQKVYE